MDIGERGGRTEALVLLGGGQQLVEEGLELLLVSKIGNAREVTLQQRDINSVEIDIAAIYFTLLILTRSTK